MPFHVAPIPALRMTAAAHPVLHQNVLPSRPRLGACWLVLRRGTVLCRIVAPRHTGLRAKWFLVCVAPAVVVSQAKQGQGRVVGQMRGDGAVDRMCSSTVTLFVAHLLISCAEQSRAGGRNSSHAKSATWETRVVTVLKFVGAMGLGKATKRTLSCSSAEHRSRLFRRRGPEK